MAQILRLRPLWGVLLAGLALGGLAACGVPDEGESYLGTAGPTDVDAEDDSAKDVPPPPFSSEDIFPCSQCHDATLPPNPTRRKLGMVHENIVLKHDEKHRWCLDCHDEKDRDHLRLASGELIPFTESYRLCGQCHGDKYRDWKAGVHGRRTGNWDGPKQYLLCVHCHVSHDPKFKPLKPLPPPLQPKDIR